MSSISNRQRINFGYKRMNHQKNHLKSTPKEFLNYEDEQYADFSQQNKKRTRE